MGVFDIAEVARSGLGFGRSQRRVSPYRLDQRCELPTRHRSYTSRIEERGKGAHLITWESWHPKTAGVQQDTRSLIRSVMGLHSTFAGEFWLWRGQADAAHGLEPGMHTRVRNTPGVPLNEYSVRVATNQLLELARANGLDRVEDLRLPDMALLAHLQHNGAATPLLDVTVDPLVAMWMVAYSSGEDPFALDDRDGWLFAIRRPSSGRWISSLDSTP